MALIDMDRRMVHVNDALCCLTGHSRDQLIGATVQTITHPDASGRWGITVSAKKLRTGAHRVKVVVTFTPSSQTKPRTLNLILVRCRRPHIVFTG